MMNEKREQQTALLQLVREAFVILGENTEALKEAKIVIENARADIVTLKKKYQNSTAKLGA